MSAGATKKPEQGALLEVAAMEKPEQPEKPTEASGCYESPRPFRPWQPDQGQLLPQYLRQVLGEKHLACFFVGLAQMLDFGPILKAYTKECGQPAYHPVMMALLLMYAYSRGVSSSREIERRCEMDLGFRYVSGGEAPDHDTLCAFRVRPLEAFRGLFVDTLRVAQEARLKKVGYLSVDGSKVKAAASKHKVMSYGRMQEAVQNLEKQVQRLLEESAALDEQEQARDRLEADMKVALAVEKERRIEKIRKAQQELAEEARQKAEAQGEKAEQAQVDPKAQRNFTDPQARIMPRDGNFQQSYNAQVAVDADTQLILAQEVGQSPSDARQLEPMATQVQANTGLVPQQPSADSGYFCREDIVKVQAMGGSPSWRWAEPTMARSRRRLHEDEGPRA